MTDDVPPTPVPPAPSTLDKVADALSTALPVVETVVSLLVPAAGPALGIGIAIAKGVIAGVPQAEALWAQFQSGNIPTQAELDAYAAVEQTAYERVMADIAAKLKTA